MSNKQGFRRRPGSGQAQLRPLPISPTGEGGKHHRAGSNRSHEALAAMKKKTFEESRAKLAAATADLDKGVVIPDTNQLHKQTELDPLQYPDPTPPKSKSKSSSKGRRKVKKPKATSPHGGDVEELPAHRELDDEEEAAAERDYQRGMETTDNDSETDRGEPNYITTDNEGSDLSEGEKERRKYGQYSYETTDNESDGDDGRVKEKEYAYETTDVDEEDMPQPHYDSETVAETTDDSDSNYNERKAGTAKGKPYPRQHRGATRIDPVHLADTDTEETEDEYEYKAPVDGHYAETEADEMTQDDGDYTEETADDAETTCDEDEDEN